MNLPRFHVPDPGVAPTAAAGACIDLSPAAAHHALRVLRLRAGDGLVLFDGRGNEYHGVLVEVAATAGKQVGGRVRVTQAGAVDREARLSICLVQALSAPEKLDWLLEKCVELGVQRVVLSATERSVVRLSAERARRRLERWRDIMAAACAQCGRNRLPELSLAINLTAALRVAGDSPQRWLLDPEAEYGLPAQQAAAVEPRGHPAPAAADRAPSAVSCVVGPEGGLSPAERGLAQSLGYIPLRLGPRTLRTETAGLVAISALLAQAGEYSCADPAARGANAAAP